MLKNLKLLLGVASCGHKCWLNEAFLETQDKFFKKILMLIAEIF